MSVQKSAFGLVDNIWETIKDVVLILKPCRFSIILLIAMLAFFILADQGRDVLRALTEQESTSYVKLIGFFVALFLWAINTWYWARVMLKFDFNQQEHITAECLHLSNIQLKRRIKIRRFLPRFLGTFAFLLTAYAFYKTGSDNTYHLENSNAYLYFTASCVVFAGLFFYITLKRRQWINQLFAKVSVTMQNQQPWMKNLAYEFKTQLSEQAYLANYKDLSDVPLLTWIMLTILGTISLLLFVLFTSFPNSAVVLGTATIFLLAAATWVCFGSVLVYAGSHYSFPVFTLLFVAAVVFSLWNNNHDIRYLKEQSYAQRTNLDKYAEKWFNDLEKNNSSAEKIPYFIIAAEGGGIRAAYWTALVLSAFQDNNADFSRHVLALSGVSGGSLGAAVFVAALHEQIQQGSFASKPANNRLKCKLPEAAAVTATSMQDCTSAVLANDFLSPTIAFMLYPDLLQRFLPFPVNYFDRSRALEQSWESAWDNVFPQADDQPGLFARNFFELWDINQSSPYTIPNLYLNSTWVETGKRVISSNLLIDSDQVFDSIDFFNVLSRDVPLSTAVHNSARFTYVSPAGQLHPPEKPVWGHLVDGGYFENSGATTAFNIMLSLYKAEKKGRKIAPENIIKPEKKLVPVVIVITNDPAVKQPCYKTGGDQEPGENDCSKQKFMNELLSPAVTMLNTRGARGSYARNEIKKYVQNLGGHYLEIGLCGGKGPLPLGWTLSDLAKKNMEQQLEDYIEPIKQQESTFNPLDLRHLSDFEKILKQACS